MSNRNRLAAAALAAALAVSGCSQLPTAPDPLTGRDSPAAPAAMTTTESATSTRVINGLLGGTVRAGDFTVVFPPLAFTGKATVTVSQPDLTSPVVDLHISPASANRFRVPVQLIARASKVDPQLLSVTCLSYFNPSTNRWEPVAGSTVNVLSLTVQAPLWHFSRYRVESGGKAGW